MDNKVKRVPKGDIKYKIDLNEEQRECVGVVWRSVITVITGKAGSGKTQVAIQAALDMYNKREVGNVVFTRAMVSTEEMGFLPGGIKEKMQPYLEPLEACVRASMGNGVMEEMYKRGEVQVIPVGFSRGVTYVNSVVVVDEVQNLSRGQLKLVLSRIGVGSRIVLTGDLDQCDLGRKEDSAMYSLDKLRGIEGIGFVELRNNMRHPILDLILDLL